MLVTARGAGVGVVDAKLGGGHPGQPTTPATTRQVQLHSMALPAGYNDAHTIEREMQGRVQPLSLENESRSSLAHRNVPFALYDDSSVISDKCWNIHLGRLRGKVRCIMRRMNQGKESL